MYRKNKQLENFLNVIAKSSIIVFIGLILSKIFTYVYRIIIARSYGPEEYGLFSIALVVVSIFISFAAMGMNEGLLRYVSIYRAKRSQKKINFIHKFSLGILTASGIILGIMLFFLSEKISLIIFNMPSLTIYLRFFSISLPLMMISYVYLSILRAYEEIGWYSLIFNIIQSFAKLFFLLILILLSLKSNAIIFSYLIGIAIMALLSYIIARYKISEIFVKYSLAKKDRQSLGRSLFSYSWPLMFYAVIFNIFFWADTFSIGFFKGAMEVGLYNAAVPIAMLLSLAPELFVQLFLPLIVKEYSRGNLGIIRELSKQVSKWILLINLPIFSIFFLFSEEVVSMFFGQNYSLAGTPLKILAVGGLISSIFIVSSNLIAMSGKSKLFLLNVILASGLNIILNVLLIPSSKIWFIENSLGINGAAIATAISLVFFNLLFFFQTIKNLSIISLRRKMFNLVISAIIPFTIVLMLKQSIDTTPVSIILLSGFIFLAYIILILLTGAADRNDLSILNKMFRKIKFTKK